MLAKLILLVFLFILSPALTYANSYSYSNLPLWYLCEKSEFIAVSRIESIDTAKENEKKLLAKNLDIVSILKGDNEIWMRYKFSGKVSLLKPDKKGDLALVFLAELMSGCVAVTSYKTAIIKVVSISEVDTYIEKISLLLEILKDKNTVSKNQQIIEWLVKCAENPITCWEGVHGLARTSDFIELLTEDQKKRLIKVLSSCRKKDEIEEYLIDIIK